MKKRIFDKIKEYLKKFKDISKDIYPLITLFCLIFGFILITTILFKFYSNLSYESNILLFILGSLLIIIGVYDNEI